MIYNICQFLIMYVVMYVIFGIILDIKNHNIFTKWNKISDSIWISKDKRFKIYYSTREWKWIFIDDKLGDLQTLDSLEDCKNTTSKILKREK